ncbi:MAG: hypothetical protein HQL47_07770, partial [Gammaproteobacteria bacterium]|nr:hypothetical protein [Gammaproteobacteria bacterium]
VFWQDFMHSAKARGSMLLLVEMPTPEQQAERPFPYLVAIPPERTARYTLDDQGQLEMAEIIDQRDGKPIVRGWDRERWWIKEGGDIVAEDQHGLGACPVLAFTESGVFPAIGAFAGIVPLSKRLMNLRSELDEILRRHTFPILAATFPMLEPADGEMPDSLQ